MEAPNKIIIKVPYSQAKLRFYLNWPIKVFKWDVLALHGKTEQVEFLSKYPPSVYLLRRKMQSGNWGKSVNFSYWIFVEFVE